MDGMQATDNFELREMMIETIVTLADKHDTLVGQFRDDAFQVGGSAQVQGRCLRHPLRIMIGYRVMTHC
jgi:hypothetical protein